MNFAKLNEAFDAKYNMPLTENIDLKNLFDGELIDSEGDNSYQSMKIKMVFKRPEDEDQFKQILANYINSTLNDDEQYIPEDIPSVEFIANTEWGEDYDHGETSSYSLANFESLDYSDDIITDEEAIKNMIKEAFGIDDYEIKSILLDTADKVAKQAFSDSLYPWE